MKQGKPITYSLFLSQEIIERRIYYIRGRKVMLDHDLASIYQITTKVLNQAVKRNLKRFPPDFMFRLTAQEKKEVVTNCDHLKLLKFSPAKPFAFTEMGVAMLSSVLNSDRAIQANIEIMRTFTKIRALFGRHKDLENRLNQLEKKYDDKFKVVFDAIRQIISPETRERKKEIGFHAKE